MTSIPDPLSILEKTPESQNPVMVLFNEMRSNIANGNMPAAEYLAMQKKVERALEDGHDQQQRIATTLQRIQRAKARPGMHIPKGL